MACKRMRKVVRRSLIIFNEVKFGCHVSTCHFVPDAQSLYVRRLCYLMPVIYFLTNAGQLLYAFVYIGDILLCLKVECHIHKVVAADMKRPSVVHRGQSLLDSVNSWV